MLVVTGGGHRYAVRSLIRLGRVWRVMRSLVMDRMLLVRSHTMVRIMVKRDGLMLAMGSWLNVLTMVSWLRMLTMRSWLRMLAMVSWVCIMMSWLRVLAMVSWLRVLAMVSWLRKMAI